MKSAVVLLFHGATARRRNSEMGKEGAREGKRKAMSKNNGGQAKIMRRRATKQRERERDGGGKREGGRLAFTTGASPKHITRAMHKYFTHTHTKQTAWHTACAVTEESARQRENVEAHSVQLHASHFSIFICRFIRN